MLELEAIAHEATKLRAEGRTFLLATVVRTRGSSYRRPGARMLVALGEGGEPERWLAGCVSGGCLETDLLLRGAWHAATGPSVVTYDSTTDDEIGWGFGLGCNGAVDVLLQRIPPDASFDPTRLFARCFEAGSPGALVTVFASRNAAVPVGASLAISPGGAIEATFADKRVAEAFREAASRAGPVAHTLEIGGVTALVETIAPAPRLFVVGTNHDAPPVVALARALGWKVTVCDTSARHAGRFERPLIGTPAAIRAAVDAESAAHVVIMTHDYERDRALLGELYDSRARYLGVLGPARRTERMLLDLGRDGTARRGLFAPVGLDLGAETPHEIALAIVAELQASLRGARAGSLRERPARFVCAVLAAGGSKRLGRPKQLVQFRGEPLVRVVTRAALGSSCARVGVIVGGARVGVEEAVRDLDVRCVANPAWEEGIASSVRAAVAWARTERAEGLVLVLADQPLLSSEHVDRLVSAVRTGAPAAGSAYDAVLGVPAAFAAVHFDALARLEGDRGAARVLRDASGAARVPWPEGSVDVDGEADVRALGRIELGLEEAR